SGAVGHAATAADADNLHLYPLRGPQVLNHETGSGLGDDGVVEADIGVASRSVVGGPHPDPGAGARQPVNPPGLVTQPGKGGLGRLDPRGRGLLFVDAALMG